MSGVLLVFSEKPHRLSAIVHCAGSWAGGPISAASIFENTDKMWDVNTHSAISGNDQMLVCC